MTRSWSHIFYFGRHLKLGLRPTQQLVHQSVVKPSGCHAGSTQGIGMGMLRGLAEAGADVMMHGLVTADEAKAKTSEIASEFGVQCRHSAADVTKPADIRYHPSSSDLYCRQREPT